MSESEPEPYDRQVDPFDNETSDRSKRFGEFPFSIRLAQRSALIAVAIPLFLRRMLRGNLPWGRVVVAAASGGCALVGFFATYYAVIRYPYMGLVDAADGDLFAKYVESNRPWVRTAGKGFAILAAVLAIVLPLRDGQVTREEGWVILYAAILLPFLVFLTFFYHREDHPTVATFLRCSMGLGILVYPLFLPALVLGSMRVRALLDDASDRMDAERRRR